MRHGISAIVLCGRNSISTLIQNIFVCNGDYFFYIEKTQSLHFYHYNKRTDNGILTNEELTYINRALYILI